MSLKWLRYHMLMGMVALFFTVPAFSQETFQIVSWNVESDGAFPETIAQRIDAFQGVDVWGLSEVKNDADASIFETAAEQGEDANFERIIGVSGASDRLAIIYDADRFELLDSDELEHINIGGNVRAPLVAHLRDRSAGFEFLFMVNHLYRSNQQRRHQQARLINQWAEEQIIPVIAVGDYNFDYHVEDGDEDHDKGYELITAGGFLEWVRPVPLVRTQCSVQADGSCRFNSVLDFVFISEEITNWQPASDIIVEAGDFPDDESTSDHRPVTARFEVPTALSPEEIRRRLLERLARIEAELEEVTELVEQLPTTTGLTAVNEN